MWRRTVSELLRQRERALLGYAYLVSCDEESAARLAERATVAVFSRLRSPRGTANAETVIRRVLVSDYLGREGRRRRWAAARQFARPHDWTPDRHSRGSTFSRDDPTIAALRTLAPHERVCLVLHVIDDLEVRDIALLLGAPPDRVRSALREAVSRLEGHFGRFEALELDTAPVANWR